MQTEKSIKTVNKKCYMPRFPLELWNIIIILSLECEDWMNICKILLCTHTMFHGIVYEYLYKINNILEKYKQEELILKPSMDGIYLRESLNTYMNNMFKSDMNLIRTIKLVKYNINFLVIDYHNESYNCIYNPFNCNEMEEMEEMKLDFIVIDADEKSLTTKRYENISNQVIRWSIKLIQTPVYELFNRRIKPKWIDTLDYNKNEKAFYEDVANMIIHYPHVEYDQYGKYVQGFMEWMDSINMINLNNINNLFYGIMDNLKVVLTKKERAECTSDDNLIENIFIKSTRYKIIECSSKCRILFKREINTFLRLIRRLKSDIEVKKTIEKKEALLKKRRYY